MRRTTAILLLLMVLPMGCRSPVLTGDASTIDPEVRARSDVPAVGDAGARASIEGLLADGLALDEALRIALVRNADLLAAYEDANIARADLLQAGLPDNPSLDADLRFVEGGGGHILEAALVQPLVSLLLSGQRKSVAQADLCAVRARLIATGLRVLGEVRRSWYDVVAAEQRVELHRTATLAARAAYVAAAELRRAGNITELDARREQAFYEEQRATLAQTQLGAYTARETLNEWLGLGGRLTAWSIETRLPELPDTDGVPADLETRAVQASQDLAHRRGEMIALGRRLGLTYVESAVRNVAVGAAAEREADGEWSVGPVIALEIPLFDHGQAALPRARALVRQSMLRYVARAVAVRTRARVEGETLGAAWRQAKHARDVIVPLRQQVLNDTLKQSNAMQIGVFQVLQAKRDLIAAGEHYVGTLHGYWASRSRTEQILAGALHGVSSQEGE